jgi:hypothetical protein
VAFGVITAAVDHGPVTFEASVFNGREPDQHRWDFDFGALDSFAGRLWFKPSSAWEIQVSSARLRKPEALEPGDITRTTASAGWLTERGSDFSAVTAGFGVNAVDGAHRQAFFAEATHHHGPNSIYGRIEAVDVETCVLLQSHCTNIDPGQVNRVGVITVGGVRDVLNSRGFEGGLGAAVTFYAVPVPLKDTHGTNPVSFQIFFRLRPPAGSMGRMFNMRMSQPMKGLPQVMNHQMN